MNFESVLNFLLGLVPFPVSIPVPPIDLTVGTHKLTITLGTISIAKVS